MSRRNAHRAVSRPAVTRGRAGRNWIAGLPGKTAYAGVVSGMLLAAAVGGVAQASSGAAARYSPDPGKFNNLTGVAALNPSNAWAVGSYCVAHCSYTSAQTDRSMIVHWNGKAWTRVASPNPGNDDVLYGVTAISRGNVWAAGWYSGGGGGALLLHWDGRKWSAAKTHFTNFLNVSSISASSAANVWAVGYGFAPRSNATLTEIIRWNGSAWKKVPSPNPGKYLDLLTGVSADSASDAWAVGQYCASRCSGRFAVMRGMALHWNGKAWSAARLPVANSLSLDAVAAVSAKDAWAAGSVSLSHNRGGPLLLHWNGKKWSKVSAAGVFAQALAFNSARHGWAAGFGAFYRWNGRSWSVVPVRVPLTSAFDSASSDRTSDAWAVGEYCAARCSGIRPVLDTITVHWNGRAWTRE